MTLLGFALMAIVAPSAALAEGPAPIPAPEGFAEVRARFDGKGGHEITAMGYLAEPTVCVSSPELGGMGVHALKFPLWSQQFQSGVIDGENPPIVLLDASLERVIGLEWEAADLGKAVPEAFGQPAILLPGHEGPPGTDVPHYMLHAYFHADDQVLFAPFDPKVSCLPDSATADVAGPVAGLSIPGLGHPVALLVGLMLVAWVGFQRRLRMRL